MVWSDLPGRLDRHTACVRRSRVSNFACIGLQPDDASSLEQLLERLLEGAVEEMPRQGAIRHLRWTDASGASMAFHLENEAVACVTPFFEPKQGLARWRVRTTAPSDDPECAHCGGADCDVMDGEDELLTRTTVQWLHSAPYREWLMAERSFSLEVVAFAHAAEFCADAASFDAAQASFWGDAKAPGDKPLRLAEEAFLPEGMFAGDSATMSARAATILTGRVQNATLAHNSLTDHEFTHVRLASLPGAIDVVCDPRALSRLPEPGDLALVHAWLVGRPTEPAPTPAQRSWLARVFGRR
jgi:hypothetical protein